MWIHDTIIIHVCQSQEFLRILFRIRDPSRVLWWNILFLNLNRMYFLSLSQFICEKCFFFFFLTSCDCSERILFRNSLNLNRLFHENEDFSWRSQIWVEIKLPSWGGPTAERWESSRRFVLYRKYVRPFQIVPVDFFFVTRLIHTSRPRANRRVSFEKPADRKFSTVTLFSPENDGGKRSSVNVFRHVFLLWLAVDLMRTDGEGAENVTRGRRRGQRRKV